MARGEEEMEYCRRRRGGSVVRYSRKVSVREGCWVRRSRTLVCVERIKAENCSFESAREVRCAWVPASEVCDAQSLRS